MNKLPINVIIHTCMYMYNVQSTYGKQKPKKTYCGGRKVRNTYAQ